MFINILKLSMIAQALNLILKPWGVWTTNLAGYVLILASYFLPFSVIYDKKEWKGHITFDILLFCGFMLCLIISAVLGLAEYGMEYELIKDTLAFVCMYATIVIEPQVYRQKDLQHIFAINKVLSIVFVAYTLLPFHFRYTLANEWGYYAFTLSLGNTNATAIQVFYCMILLVIEIVTVNKIRLYFVNIPIMGALFYTLYLLQCRTVMLCSILIVVMIVFRNIPIKQWYVYFAMLVPIVAVSVQMLFTDESFMIMGKGLITGREVLYAEYFEIINESPIEYLFGSLCRHRLNNYHNGPIAIFMNMGLFGCLMCICIWVYSLRYSIKNMTTLTQKIAIVGLMIYLIHASAEAAPMMGMILYGTPVMVLFRLAKDQFLPDEKVESMQAVRKHSKYERISHA